jgi:hypothetical protein
MSQPWVVRWQWNTGYNGVDRFPTAERATRFCDEMLRRVDPPELDLVSLAAFHEPTGQRLGDYLNGDRELSAEEAAVRAHVASLPAMGEKTCGTCDGEGTIPIIQTGGKKTCSRCNGTGKEQT